MTSPLLAAQAVSALGLHSTLHYAKYQIQLRSGWLRRSTPLADWAQFDPGGQASPNLSDLFPFQPGADSVARRPAWSEGARAGAVAAADALLAGRFTLFGCHQVELGADPDWGRFAPLAGGEELGAVALDRHWTEYDLERLGADVRLLWEPSRFRWLYTLGRAYRWTGEQRYAERAWELVASWRDANPPNHGPHWISAQEVAFRLLALTFGYVTVGAAWRDDRMESVRRMVAAHAARIPPTLAYSQAQGNNHLLSEAVGLYTAGACFPRLAGAERWRRLGRRFLIDGLEQQVFEDGGYVQHSTNYARLALELGLWGVRLAAVCDEPLAGASQTRLRGMAALLSGLADPSNGRVPMLGPQDGSQLLPLSACPFGDYRPTLRAAMAMLGGMPHTEAGSQDELSHWLGADPAGQPGPRNPAGTSYPVAGLYCLRQNRARGVLRVVRFRGRPGHADQLHLDLWRRGRNPALDPGTYLYNGEPPWRNALSSALVHNTLCFDGAEPMKRAGRFLWLDWSEANVESRSRSADGDLEAIVAIHRGHWDGDLAHRRVVVRIGEDLWMVVDDALGKGRHRLTLPWLLPDGQWSLEGDRLEVAWAWATVGLKVTGEGPAHSLYRGGALVAGPPAAAAIPQWGWRAPTYAVREPALHWVTELVAALPARLKTWWAFDGADPSGVKLSWSEDGSGLPRLSAVRWRDHELEL